MPKLVGPLDDHRARDPNGWVGVHVVVAPPGERRDGVPEECVLGTTAEVRGLRLQLVVDGLHQRVYERRCRLGRSLDDEGAAADVLPLPHHVQVQRRHHLRDANLVLSEECVRPSHLRHQGEADRPPRLVDLPCSDEPPDSPSRLHRGPTTRGVIVSGGLGVADVGHDDHLFLCLPRNCGDGVLHRSLV